jgi:[acyl-carrier-protein] S-malonyltransferase
MRPAQHRMRAELDAAVFQPLRVPLVNNWQAREVLTAGDAREGLYHQIPNPVLWIDTVRHLAASGVTLAIEVGAGAVLSGLIRQIDPSIKTASFGGPDPAADWEKLRAFL